LYRKGLKDEVHGALFQLKKKTKQEINDKDSKQAKMGSVPKFFKGQPRLQKILLSTGYLF